eukprot:scaffold79023_cov47-Prasinocladus_malaysianus.AAC.1
MPKRPREANMNVIYRTTEGVALRLKLQPSLNAQGGELKLKVQWLNSTIFSCSAELRARLCLGPIAKELLPQKLHSFFALSQLHDVSREKLEYANFGMLVYGNVTVNG